MRLPRIFSRQKAVAEQKASVAKSAMVINLGQPVWSDRDYKAFSREAYGMNVVAYRCISAISEAVASVDLLAYRGADELANAPILDLLKRPNPMQSQGEFLEAVTAFWLISGNYYIEKVTASGNAPKELYALRPDRMKIIAGSAGVPQAYQYEVSGRKVVFDVDPSTGESDVWHGKFFSPTNDWYGQSPVEAGAYAIDQHTEAMKWMQALLQNSATPSGALVTKDDKDLSDEQFARLKGEMESQYQGAKNAGRPLLLEGGLDWKQMGLSPTDMGIIETKYSSARDICLAFGVPPMLIGIPGDNTYANYAEARLAFWEDTVLPLVARLLTDLAHWIGDGVILKPDLDQIPAIVGKRRTLWEMLDKATSLTVDEKREAMGYEPLPNGAGQVLSAKPETTRQPEDTKALAIIAGYHLDTKRKA